MCSMRGRMVPSEGKQEECDSRRRDCDKPHKRQPLLVHSEEDVIAGTSLARLIVSTVIRESIVFTIPQAPGGRQSRFMITAPDQRRPVITCRADGYDCRTRDRDQQAVQ